MNEPAGVTFAAPAKINLYLHVTGKRDDGYHLLDSLVAFAGVNDTVAARLSADMAADRAVDLTLSVTGPFAPGLTAGPDNMVLRAARALAAAAGVTSPGAALTLTKRLPPASGMGGGSADAAAALKALVRLWDLHVEPAALAELALGLGADVPVCLRGQAVFMGGIGDEMTVAPVLPPAWLVLVNPGICLSTPEVFTARAGDFSAAARFDAAPADAAELADILKARRNGLTPAAVSLAPVVGEVLSAIKQSEGVLLSRMTGSGATCFGLFSDADAATRVALSIGESRPGWWVKPASLEGDATRLQSLVR